MAFLTDEQLEALREWRRQSFTDIAKVYRRITSPDGSGGRITTRTLIGTYPCALTPGWQPREDEIPLAQIGDVRDMYRLYIDYDCVLMPNDIVQVRGVDYEVISVPRQNISATYAVVRTAL